MPVETRAGGQRPGKREGTRSHSKLGSSSTNYKEIEKQLSSRPAWDDKVVEEVYRQAENSKNNGVTTYKCAMTGEILTRDQTSIDHIVDWQRYCQTYCEKNGGLNDDGSLDRDIVKEGYNDITNLRVVSKPANSSKGNRRVPF